MKPVAWIDEETTCFVYSQSEYEELSEYDKGGLIPLYTAPRELSDEEIIQTACDEFYGLIKKEERPAFIRFARAILKKTSEK